VRRGGESGGGVWGRGEMKKGEVELSVGSSEWWYLVETYTLG